MKEENPVEVIPGDELINMNQDIQGVDMEEGALESNDLNENTSTDMTNYQSPQEENNNQEITEITPHSDSTWGES